MQAGRFADLVLLNANPLVDIASSQHIVDVLADGQYLLQQDLQRLRKRLQLVATEKYDATGNEVKQADGGHATSN